MISADDIEAMGFDYYNLEEKETKMTPQQMLLQYHETAGLDIGEYMPQNIKELDAMDAGIKTRYQSLSQFRLDLVEEEFEEVRLSDTKENLLKELADLVYVTYGLAVTFGLDLDEALVRVHQNNMGRMYQPDGTIKRRDDGKILKNKDYPKVDLGDLV